jgi:hypothetical protein
MLLHCPFRRLVKIGPVSGTLYKPKSENFRHGENPGRTGLGWEPANFSGCKKPGNISRRNQGGDNPEGEKGNGTLDIRDRPAAGSSMHFMS